ncbi:extensin family protein [Novosphingobium panipatense]|uniref:Uncharacterized conserved protein n=1 Tax=Novosphingobium panipatense TaxID=428991 RepID=A0ABY1QQE4_9SPHN|nr:extensin family protein [Novosphingobium panipatense]SMP76064.1 Uncharacterized conserved protein [Novosphingobium panipatense]
MAIFLRLLIVALMLGGIVLGAREWLRRHPEHDPRAPLTLSTPDGWMTARKVAALREDRDQCRAFLRRSGIEETALAPVGTGECRRDDRKVLRAPARFDVALSPRRAQATCAVDAGLARWLNNGVQPAAKALLGQAVVRIEQLGTYSCRRIGGGDEGNWSEHATGNAIDISAFVLADGTRISVLRDWGAAADEPDGKSLFLRTVRDRACAAFSTVLSPEYNAAHADHLHLDQARRGGSWTACR